MPKMLQVRDVPDRVHREQKRRAARRGMTLSAYVLEELVRMEEELPIDEWVEEVRKHPRVRLRSSVAGVVRQGRPSR